MSQTATTSRPTFLRLLLALALCAVAILAWRAAPTLAHGSHAACVSPKGRGAWHTHTCAKATRTKRAHGKAKRHHGQSSSKSKKKGKAQHGSTTHTAAPVLAPAICEDGSTPARGAEGYECADGGEPECPSGAAPVAHGSRLLCPLAAAPPGEEWSEAVCEDGSAPASTSTGGYACEDGSAPVCEDGPAPSAAAEGSTLACLVPSSSSSAPGPASEEGEAEDS